MQIRRASLPVDSDSVWAILEPTIRAGETYTLPRDMSREDALDYWFAPGHEVFVAEEDSNILGTYFLQSNQQGGGSPVANCGYVTAPWATSRGVARAMCAHSLDRARERSFTAMQFNFTVLCHERQCDSAVIRFEFSASMICFPWNRPFSMKISPVCRPPITTPAR